MQSALPGAQPGRAVQRFGDLWGGKYRPTLLPGRGRLMAEDMHALILAFVSAVVRERDTRVERQEGPRRAVERDLGVTDAGHGETAPEESPLEQERRLGRATEFVSPENCVGAVGTETRPGARQPPLNLSASEAEREGQGGTREEGGDKADQSRHKYMKEGAFELFSFLFYKRRFSYIHQAAALESQEEVWRLMLVVWQALFSSPPSRSASASPACLLVERRSPPPRPDTEDGRDAPASSTQSSTDTPDGDVPPGGEPSASEGKRNSYEFLYRVGCVFLLLWLLYTAPFPASRTLDHTRAAAVSSSSCSDSSSAAGGEKMSKGGLSAEVQGRAPTENARHSSASPGAPGEHGAHAGDPVAYLGLEPEQRTHRKGLVLPAVAALSVGNVELMVEVAQTCLKRDELLDGARAFKFLWGSGKICVAVFPEAEEACGKRGLPLGVNKALLFSSLQRQPVAVERPHPGNLHADVHSAAFPIFRLLEELPNSPLVPRDSLVTFSHPHHQHRYDDLRGRTRRDDSRGRDQAAGPLQAHLYAYGVALQQMADEEPLPWVDERTVEGPSSAAR
ncbi:hypothetical protein BESB_060140 [Besnoitia besnoiti]|uniref:Uncharacterized protein n=1 Tax=Besnoitia besnoiti TaxID=94643 RepID=A0A2A9MHR0_BESBE|nr:hypothetical protein BESB_060140 [Besnoitia besnoiti]PFH35127.1 hypothetical protein BESB_060140 [Besnoitia besnoiti]